MKLHFLAAHPKLGGLRKNFLKDGTSRAYPNASKIQTFEEVLDMEDPVAALDDYRTKLVDHASKGHGLLKGNFQRMLNWESRAGQTNVSAKTRLLVLDVDGIPMDGMQKGKKNAHDVTTVAENILQILPKELRSVSYCALASSSFGLKEGVVSIHIHFLLDKEYDSKHIKLWLDSLNFLEQSLFEKLELAKAKMSVKRIVDPCLAENSRIVYIAPPSFGLVADNPFDDNANRVVVNHKDTPTLHLEPLLESASMRSALTDKRKTEKLQELQKEIGIKPKVRKTDKITIDGSDYSVVTNPEEVMLIRSYENEREVRYNIGGGTNNAYVVYKNNPEIVHSYIPDEPNFLFRKADPQAYADHIRDFGEGFQVVIDGKTGARKRENISMFYDYRTDEPYTMHYDIDEERINDLKRCKDPDKAKEYLRFMGVVVPDPIPFKTIVTNFNNDVALYEEEGRSYVNRFVRPEPLRDVKNIWPREKIPFGDFWTLSIHCPLHADLILHMLGDDMECFERFVNWFAFICQNFGKTETAWLLQGTQGTGKGYFFKHVAKPLLSKKYTAQTQLERMVDDQFNGWMEELVLIMVDEFDMKGASASVRKTEANLKQLISEPTFPMRKMQRETIETPQRFNFIMSTNQPDALTYIDLRRFNIATRQPRDIISRPRFQLMRQKYDEFDELFHSESQAFISFLMNCEIDIGAVKEIVRNDAHNEVAENAMSASDMFFNNIQTGNFEAFIHVLDSSGDHLDDKAKMKLHAMKRLVTNCLPHVNTGNPCYIHKDDAIAMYSYISTKDINKNAFTKMMKHAGLTYKRNAEPVGAVKKMMTRPECIEVIWSYPDQDELEIIRGNNSLPEGVVKFGRNEQAQAHTEELKNKSSW